MLLSIHVDNTTFMMHLIFFLLSYILILFMKDNIPPGELSYIYIYIKGFLFHLTESFDAHVEIKSGLRKLKTELQMRSILLLLLLLPAG